MTRLGNHCDIRARCIFRVRAENLLGLHSCQPLATEHSTSAWRTTPCGGRRRKHESIVPGFRKKYDVTRLVYFEEFDDIDAAIHRETRLKRGWMAPPSRAMTNMDG
jgi:hypothetical protein